MPEGFRFRFAALNTLTPKTDTCPGCGEPITVAVGLGFCPTCLVDTTVFGDEKDGDETVDLEDTEKIKEDGGDDKDKVVGPYRILRPLAEGGFGEVFLAKQLEPFPRQVALKILKKGMDTKQVVARFRAEEQALALMDHESIATVFDAGVTDDGRPYFAMEYVAGNSITRFCNENTLSFDEMLELYRRVCLAVHHAHQKGIIHRDLKPSNVMVTHVDGRPVPKIIDFGIAKATQHMFLGTTMITGLNEAIGTPEYMSPEQTESGGLDIDTRTDIYSLGILLYELLTGSPPFKLDKSIEELRHSVLNEDPPKPTLEMQTESDHLTRFAKMREMEPGSIRRRVKGDLEWIVMKAIDKDRDRRYVSAAAFAEDLRCYLNHEPVKARPPSLAYQLGKYVRRHRAGVAIAGVVVVSAAAALLALSSAQRQTAASAAYNRLITASPESVPVMLSQTDEYLSVLRAELRSVADDPKANRHEWLRATLALLPIEPQRVADVSDRISEATPNEMIFILDRLEQKGGALLPKALETIGTLGESREARLRAAAVLARFDPKNDQLRVRSDDLVYWLTSESPDAVPAWIGIFRPIASDLLLRFEEYYLDESRGDASVIAAMFLGAYRAGEEEFLTEMVKRATARQMPFIVKGLREAGAEGHARLMVELSKTLDPEEAEHIKDERSDQIAHVGIALIKMGYERYVWPYLRHSGDDEDPRLRTLLIHAMAEYAIEPAVLVELFTDEADTSIRRAALMALGGYSERAISPLLRDRFKADLMKAFREDPDSGIHSLAEWLLKKWGYEDDIKLMSNRKKKRTQDQVLDEDVGYYINSEGHTMIVLKGSVTFEMGSPAGEVGRADDEVKHMREIPRTFAIASRHVAVGQFREIARTHPKIRRDPAWIQADDDLPLNAMRSSDTLYYCNWLSKMEGIPEDQWCYETLPGKRYPSAVPDCLMRTGYRLPTEAEWEYACRAGAITPYPWGSRGQLSIHYAWSKANSGGRSQIGGMLCPNDFGMFDMLGSLVQWCHEYYEPYPEPDENGIVLDWVARPRTGHDLFLQRGAHYTDDAARSAQRVPIDVGKVSHQRNSFRVARTIEVHSEFPISANE